VLQGKSVSTFSKTQGASVAFSQKESPSEEMAKGVEDRWITQKVRRKEMEYARARQEQTRNRYGVEFRVYLRPLRMRSGATRCPLFSLPLQVAVPFPLAGWLFAREQLRGWLVDK
jgi:hypothetical protein